jgi:micrococcal nuclease
MTGVHNLLSVLILACFGFLPDTGQAPADPVQGVYHAVLEVVDGDTFWIDDGSEKGVKIRLIGIDAPETRNSGKKSAHPYGKTSKDFLQSLIGAGKVRLEYDVRRRDQYKRLLVYAFLPNGRHVNAEMVRQGQAQIMTVPPNVKYSDYFYSLQVEARGAGRGLWAMP